MMRRARPIRLQAGKGLRQTAQAIGIDPGALSRFETHKGGLSVWLLRALARYLEVPMEALIETSDNGHEPTQQQEGR
jgi:transcriptional regulator with XRE-family HTH domain